MTTNTGPARRPRASDRGCVSDALVPAIDYKGYKDSLRDAAKIAANETLQTFAERLGGHADLAATRRAR